MLIQIHDKGWHHSIKIQYIRVKSASNWGVIFYPPVCVNDLWKAGGSSVASMGKPISALFLFWANFEFLFLQLFIILLLIFFWTNPILWLIKYDKMMKKAICQFMKYLICLFFDQRSKWKLECTFVCYKKRWWNVVSFSNLRCFRAGVFKVWDSVPPPRDLKSTPPHPSPFYY